MPSTTVRITHITHYHCSPLPLRLFVGVPVVCTGKLEDTLVCRIYLRLPCCCHLGQLTRWLLGSSPVPTPRLTVITDVCYCIQLLMGAQGPEPRYETCVASILTCCATLLVPMAIILYSDKSVTWKGCGAWIRSFRQILD